jgi:hypothetical protein
MEPSTEGLLVWILIYLVAIGGLFWSLYRAFKTRNVKYGYAVFANVILMTLLLFI